MFEFKDQIKEALKGKLDFEEINDTSDHYEIILTYSASENCLSEMIDGIVAEIVEETCVPLITEITYNDFVRRLDVGFFIEDREGVISYDQEREYHIGH